MTLRIVHLPMATRSEETYPVKRMGSLDVNVLCKHGLMADRMMDDPQFFYQLLFQFCDPSKSVIENDN